MDEVDSGSEWAGFQSSERSWTVSQELSQSFTYSSHRYRISTSSSEDVRTITRHFSSSSCDVISPTGSDLTQSHDSESQGGFDDLDSGMGSSNFDDVDSGVGSSYYEDADLGVHLSPVSGPSYIKSPGYGGLSFMKPQELAFLLKVGLEKHLLIDSRSFLEYNTSHIQQSANVCCSKLVKRRLQRDKVQIQDLLMQSCHIDVDEFTDVIVYDQCTENPALLPDDSFLSVLLSKLCMTFRRVALLKGGFLAFQAMYPSLCESKTNSYRCAALTSLSQPCLPVSNVGPTRILPFLYLGSQQDAMSPDIVQVNEITYVLNVSTTCMKPAYISDGHFLRIPVNDNYSAKLQPYFNEAFQFLDKVREANGCCLVHCLAGISRSPTLAIAYIMKHLNMSSDDAYRYVKDKRPTISPNFNFLGQLLEFEKQMKRERELNNNSSGALALKTDTRLWSNYVMDLSSHSPSSPGTKTVRPFTFDSSDSQDSNHTGGQIRKQNDDDLEDRHEGNVKHFKNGTCKLDFPRMKSRTFELKSSFESSGDVNKETKQSQDAPFQFPKEVCVRPNVLNLGFDSSRRLPTSLSIVKDPISAMSKSLTDIKETTESETPSPVCTKSQDLTFSTSRVKYETRSAKPLLSPSPMCERFVKPFPPFPSDNAVCKSDHPDATVKPLNSPFPCGETTVKTLESPFPCGESTIHGLLSPYPCGQSTVPYLSQDQKSSVSITRDSGNVHNTETEAQDGHVTPSSAESWVSHGSLSESKHVTHLQPAATTSANSLLQSSEVFMKSRGKRPLRSSLSLSLSAITPTRSTAQTNTLSSSLSGDGHSVLKKYDQTMCKIERKKSESVPDILHNLSNIPTASSKSLVTQSSGVPLSASSSSVTMSHVVKLKSFNLLSPSSPLALPAQSPTSSLAQLHFGSTENSDNETDCPMDTSQEESKLASAGEWIPGQKAFNENLDKGLNLLNTFKSTSLDKLNFTPCLSNSVENIQATGTSRGVGLKRPLNNDILDIKESELLSSGSVTSSMNSSSNNSLLSSPTAAGSSQKVVVRKREGRAKRTLVRPNSIAFSTYPTFDLGSDCQDSPHSSSSATSQDDASEAYTQNGKKSKPSEYMNDVKFRLGRYSEREVYRQITAAMETAMLKTQVYEASRKSRSLDDILSSEDDSSAPNCESSMFDRVLRHCALSRDRYTSPTQLFEKLACGSGHAASEVYHSNSSLSSTGSHTSLHGSMELIQVS